MIRWKGLTGWLLVTFPTTINTLLIQAITAGGMVIFPVACRPHIPHHIRVIFLELVALFGRVIKFGYRP